MLQAKGAAVTDSDAQMLCLDLYRGLDDDTVVVFVVVVVVVIV